MRPKTRALTLFAISAIATASLAIAKPASAYWRYVHAGTCFYQNYGWGFQSEREQFQTNGAVGITYTGYKSGAIVCPDNMDSNTWGGPYTPNISAKFYRASTLNPMPRVQACSNVSVNGASSCTPYYYGGSTGFYAINFLATGYWKYNAINYVYVPFDATNQDYNKMVTFQGVTIGTEFGPGTF
jgi:hypothetical protein